MEMDKTKFLEFVKETKQSTDENSENGYEMLMSMLFDMAPTMIDLIERQARTETMLHLAEKVGVLPKGMNQLGDMVVDRLRTNKEVSAIKEAAAQRQVVPFAYAQVVREKTTEIEQNDQEMRSLIKELIANG